MQKRIFGIENEYAYKRASVQRGLERYLGGIFWSNPEHSLLKPFMVVPEGNFFSAPQSSYHIPFWLGSNGAKFYFDSPSRVPEYCTPECSSVFSLVSHDKAGEVFLDTLRLAVESNDKNVQGSGYEGPQDLSLSKITTVSAGNEAVKEVGCHENYLTTSYFSHVYDGGGGFINEFINFLSPFLVSRVILHGGGGLRQDSGIWQYVISHRAFAIFQVYSLSTLSNRPLFNLKHKNVIDGDVRLQVICSDPTISPFSTYMKIGSTHLVLRLIEENPGIEPPVRLRKVDDVLRHFSSDPTLKKEFKGDGFSSGLTALDLQGEYLNLALRHLKELNEEEKRILADWEWTLENLKEDPETMHRHLEWVIKMHWLRKLGYDFSDKKAIYFDFAFSDISDKGVYNRLRKAGKVEEFISDGEILKALLNPPQTRAAVRAKFVRYILKNNLRDWGIDWQFLKVSPFDKIFLRDYFSVQNRKLEEIMAKV